MSLGFIAPPRARGSLSSQVGARALQLPSKPAPGTVEAAAGRDRGEAEDGRRLARAELLPCGQPEQFAVSGVEAAERGDRLARALIGRRPVAYCVDQFGAKALVEPGATELATPVVGESAAGDAIEPESGLWPGRDVGGASPGDQKGRRRRRSAAWLGRGGQALPGDKCPPAYRGVSCLDRSAAKIHPATKTSPAEMPKMTTPTLVSQAGGQRTASPETGTVALTGGAAIWPIRCYGAARRRARRSSTQSVPEPEAQSPDQGTRCPAALSAIWPARRSRATSSRRQPRQPGPDVYGARRIRTADLLGAITRLWRWIPC